MINQSVRESELLRIYPTIDQDFFTWLHNSNYFSAPASTHYHGAYEGGLFDHSFTVAKILNDLTKDNRLSWQRPESPTIIGLFHDICKIDQYVHSESITKYCEFNTETLYKGHGDKSVIILASHIKLTDEEVACIRYHMGAFTDQSEWEYYTRAIREYPNVLWTHHADMIAAQIVEEDI